MNEKTVVNSWNEWDPLKHVIVGKADGTCIPAPEPALDAKVPEDSDMRGQFGPRTKDTVDKANELLDNLPFDLLEGDGECWKEVCIGLMNDQFVETLMGESKESVGLPPVKGARIPVQNKAHNWVENALETIVSGSLLVIDYASTTQEMSQRPQDSWLRTFKKHSRGNNPLDNIGNQDITVEVAIDQLPNGASVSTQRDFLKNQGIDSLVEEGRHIWKEFSSVGDLKAVKARSRITEAEALLDPNGLGGFFVLEWNLPSVD